MFKKSLLLFSILLLSTCEVIPELEIILEPEIIPEIIPEEKINVYFCGGQSNANEIWFETIKNRILDVDSSAILIHSYHSGQSISSWYDLKPMENYTVDLLEIQSNLSGIDYDIRGFFWFQGESDRFRDLPEFYQRRFYNLIDQFEYDLNDSFPIFMTIVNLAYQDATENIRLVQKSMINADDNICWIDSLGSPTLHENTSHMRPPEYIRLGNEISDVAIEILYGGEE